MVNKTSLVSLSFFYQYLWMIFVDMLVISFAEKCFRLGLNHFISLKKVNLYKFL